MRNHSYENDFDLHENETACRIHFHMKGFALRLVLRQRYKRTRKWPKGPVMFLTEMIYGSYAPGPYQNWRRACANIPHFNTAASIVFGPITNRNRWTIQANSGQNILVFVPGLWFTKKFGESAEWCKSREKWTDQRDTNVGQRKIWVPYRNRTKSPWIAPMTSPTPGGCSGPEARHGPGHGFVPRSCHVDGFAI